MDAGPISRSKKAEVIAITTVITTVIVTVIVTMTGIAATTDMARGKSPSPPDDMHRQTIALATIRGGVQSKSSTATRRRQGS
jgi:hypothetical protein